MADRVSVIVPVRNAVAHVRGALESIAAQTRPVEEIIVVDGRSTDDTLAVVADFPDVRVVDQPGEGLADARNYGVAETTGTVLAFLDADDRWVPTKTTDQLAALDAHPELAVVAGYMRRERPSAPGEPATTETIPALTPGGVLVRRWVFDRIGGFDGRYRIGCDTDWLMRVHDAGIGPMVLAGVVLHKRARAESLSRDVRSYRAELLSAVRDSARRRDEESRR